MVNWQETKSTYKIINYAQITKKLKTHSIKTKKLLVSYKTIANNKFKLTGNGFLPVFAETKPEVQTKDKIVQEKNKIK